MTLINLFKKVIDRAFQSTSLTMSWFKNLFIPVSNGTKAAVQGMKLANPGAFIEHSTEIPLREWLPRFRPSERVGRYLSSDLSMRESLSYTVEIPC